MTVSFAIETDESLICEARLVSLQRAFGQCVKASLYPCHLFGGVLCDTFHKK